MNIHQRKIFNILDAFNNRLAVSPIIVYFESYNVAYDSIKDNNINNSYAGKHDYVEDYLHQILAIDIQYQLRLFKRHTGTGPCVIYFQSDKVTYDLRVTNRNIHRTCAGEHDYTIIQVVPQPSLLSFE